MIFIPVLPFDEAIPVDHDPQHYSNALWQKTLTAQAEAGLEPMAQMVQWLDQNGQECCRVWVDIEHRKPLPGYAGGQRVTGQCGFRFRDAAALLNFTGRFDEVTISS